MEFSRVGNHTIKCVITEDEIFDMLNPHKNLSDVQMKEKLREMIEWNKQRMETDNISAIYIKLK